MQARHAMRQEPKIQIGPGCTIQVPVDISIYGLTHEFPACEFGNFMPAQVSDHDTAVVSTTMQVNNMAVMMANKLV